jgi:hypothetical protein
MKEDNLAVVVGYIMHYDLLVDINGSFFSKIDKAIEIGKEFCLTFSAEEGTHWIGDLNFKEGLNKFLINKNN